MRERQHGVVDFIRDERPHTRISVEPSKEGRELISGLKKLLPVIASVCPAILRWAPTSVVGRCSVLDGVEVVKCSSTLAQLGARAATREKRREPIAMSKAPFHGDVPDGDRCCPSGGRPPPGAHRRVANLPRDRRRLSPDQPTGATVFGQPRPSDHGGAGSLWEQACLTGDLTREHSPPDKISWLREVDHTFSDAQPEATPPDL